MTDDKIQAEIEDIEIEIEEAEEELEALLAAPDETSDWRNDITWVKAQIRDLRERLEELREEAVA